jgi:Family of unknown function (DUF5752)
MSNGTRAAAEPFQFFTVEGVARAEDRKANTVRELLHGLETCSDDSVYYHMIDLSGSEDFVNGNASNGFAKWGACDAGVRRVIGTTSGVG